MPKYTFIKAQQLARAAVRKIWWDKTDWWEKQVVGNPIRHFYPLHFIQTHNINTIPCECRSFSLIFIILHIHPHVICTYKYVKLYVCETGVPKSLSSYHVPTSSFLKRRLTSGDEYEISKCVASHLLKWFPHSTLNSSRVTHTHVQAHLSCRTVGWIVKGFAASAAVTSSSRHRRYKVNCIWSYYASK